MINKDGKSADTLLRLLMDIKKDLFEYLNLYIKISLDKHPIKDFLSFKLIKTDSLSLIEKVLSFSENKEEYYKVLWNVLSGKNKYNDFKIKMYISDYVTQYISNGVIDFFRNHTKTVNLLIKSLKEQNFFDEIKNTIKNNSTFKDDIFNELTFVLDNSKDRDADPSSVGIFINLLDRVLASEKLRNYVELGIKNSEITLNFDSELLKDLYGIMGIDIVGNLFLTFLPVIISGVLVGAVNFKKSIIKYIQKSVISKIGDKLDLITNIFTNKDFSKKALLEIYNMMLLDMEFSSETAEFLEVHTTKSSESAKTDNIPKKVCISNIFAYMKVLAAMMWADGKLQTEELSLWEKITSLDLGLSVKQVKELEDWFKEGPSLDIIGTEINDKKEQKFVIRQAMLMSMVDGEVDQKEIELIHFLADEFEISNKELEALELEAKHLLLID